METMQELKDQIKRLEDMVKAQSDMAGNFKRECSFWSSEWRKTRDLADALLNAKARF